MQQYKKGAVKVLAVTPAGKEIGWRESGWAAKKEIAFKDGGQLPEKLKGYWNDERQIAAAIKSYIEGESAKESSKKQVTKAAKSNKE